MSNRRLAEDHLQPASFAFSRDREADAKKWVKKYPKGREQSAVIPLLWLAQEQEGWVSKPAIETVAKRLNMPFIRVLEVATFYTMFQLRPVGKRAHIQVCGTTPCMLRGAEDLKDVCRRRISPNQFEVAQEGNLSWEEVECAGACVNAPMVQIFSDTYEDLTPEKLEEIIETFAAGTGNLVKPGPQIDRHYSAPAGGATTLVDETIYESRAGKAGKSRSTAKAGKAKAEDAAKTRAAKPKADTLMSTDTVKEPKPKRDRKSPQAKATAAAEKPASASGSKARSSGSASAKAYKPSAEDLKKEEAEIAEKLAALPKGASATEKANAVGKKPRALKAPRKAGADDLKKVLGIGPVNERKLNELGIFHWDQIAKWNRSEIAWVGTYLAFPGRIDRENWTEQADVLATSGPDEHAKRFGKGAR